MNIPKSRQSEIVIQELETETLIYDLKSNKAFCLNETSAMVYQLCNGKNTVAEISQQLSEQSKQSITEDLIWLALDNFKKNNLLEKSEQFAVNLDGFNRRQVIKKVGLASLIALPMVSSVIAPSAAMAQSGSLALNAACTTNLQCQSGNCFANTKCCAPGTVTGNAPGTVVNPCNFTFACSNILPPQCCSGMTSFTVTNCSAPNPGSGSCACV